MKRLLILFLSLIMIVSLAACGHKTPETPDNPSSSDSPSESSTEAPVIPGGMDINIEQILNYTLATGDITNYTLDITRTVGNKTTVRQYCGNGKGLYSCFTKTSTPAATGTIVVTESTKYFDTNTDTIYTVKDGELSSEAFGLSEITINEALNECIGNKFLSATVFQILKAGLKTGKYEYTLDQYHIDLPNETIFFDTATVKLDKNYRLIEFHSVSGPQQTDIVISELYGTQVKIPEK